MLENRSVARRVGVLDRPEPLIDHAGVTVRPLPPEARFVLRLPFAEAQRVGAIAGVTLGLPINRYDGEARMAARLGPNEWLLIAPEADAEIMQAQLASALASVHHALVDISHRNIGIIVSGARASNILNAGCPLDLGDGKFPAGSATRTLFGKAEIVLFRLADAAAAGRPMQPSYRIECWRSFGRYVDALLAEAALG